MQEDLTRRRKMRLAIEGGRETLLVVEHDELIRGELRRGLRALGYRVIDASSAADASDLLRTDVVDLAISRLAIPGMTAVAENVTTLWLSAELVGSAPRLAAAIRSSLERPS